MVKIREVTGSVQSKITKKGKEYLYTVISAPHLGRNKWEATGLEAKGNMKKAETILRERIRRYENIERELKEQSALKNRKVIDNNIKFLDWMQEYVEESKATVRQSTWEGYGYKMNPIREYFETQDLMLSELSVGDIRDFVNHLLLYGKTDKKTGERGGMAVATVRAIKTLISSALNEAVERKYVESNVALSVSVGKKLKSSVARKIKFMTMDELNKFLEYISEIKDEMADIVKVMAVYGLRRSEALGLYIGKNSVDLENRRLCISRTVVKVQSIHDEDNVKSNDSFREFYITDDMLKFFQRVVKKKEEDKAFYGKTYQYSKSLFTWEDGQEFSPDYLEHHFKKVMKKYGRPDFTLHNLRHSCASYLIALGWSETDVMSWIGHSDYACTHKWYVVIEKAYKKKQAESLDGKLSIL